MLKVVCSPFGGGGLSVKRAYLAVADSQLMLADWTLDAAERARDLFCSTGWALNDLPKSPFRLTGRGRIVLPSGTWIVLYTDAVYSLYQDAGVAFARLTAKIDRRPTNLALFDFRSTYFPSDCDR